MLNKEMMLHKSGDDGIVLMNVAQFPGSPTYYGVAIVDSPGGNYGSFDRIPFWRKEDYYLRTLAALDAAPFPEFVNGALGSTTNYDGDPIVINAFFKEMKGSSVLTFSGNNLSMNSSRYIPFKNYVGKTITIKFSPPPPDGYL